MPHLILEGRKIFFRQGGRPTGSRPLVFIHGAGGSSNVWLRQLQAFEEDFFVLAIDLPGHGDSEGEGAESVEAYSRILSSFLDALAIEEALLVGHSMGGAIAMVLALAHPLRVKGMALVGSGARLRVPPEVFSALELDFKEAIRVICRYAYSPHFPAYLLRLGEAEVGKTDPRVLLSDFSACNAFDLCARLAEITANTLVMCGREDRFTPLKLSKYLCSHIPHSRLEIIERAGHMAMIENAPAFNAALSRFLGEPIFS
ncbi:MAG: alpha/beta hydrolase [candidate division NC10 bacterium]|nr:alpha/beta hydrolase [candidate division NC10 bacterium]